MASHLSRLLAVAALSVSTVYAYLNSSSIDMMRAQLPLMDDRPQDYPPWYASLLYPLPSPKTRVQY